MIPQMLKFMRKNSYSKWTFWHFALETLLVIGAFGGPFVTAIFLILALIPSIVFPWNYVAGTFVLTVLDIAAMRYISNDE